MSAEPLPPQSLLEAARKLVPMVLAHADEGERLREMPRPLFEALADAGLFLIAAPRDVGGHEVDLPTYLKIIETLGEADASTAWAVNQGATFGWHASRMKPQAARVIWAETPRAVVSNSPVPTGKAVVAPGGFRVSAKQGFSTGIRHASWIAVHATVMEQGEARKFQGLAETRYCLVPKANVQVHDTWKVRGMRGTGTHSFAVEDVFVPEERTVISISHLAPQLCGGVRYKIPLSLSFASGDGMAALAAARHCMTAFCELAGAKAPRYMQGLLRDQAISQFAVGESEAQLRSARALTMEAAEELWADVAKNGVASMEKRSHARLASVHGLRTAAAVVERLYGLCGGDGIFEGGIIQRLFQDTHVMMQHVQARHLNYELVGKYKLGVLTDDPRM